jgi:hypothetical protein
MFWLKRVWPLLLGILYLASPIDVVPDTLLGLGWSDDLLLLLLAYWLFRRMRDLRGQGQSMGGETCNGGDGGSRAAEEHERPGEKDPYEILGLSPGASQQEIKSAYRRQAQRYHPDRVSHLGEEFQHLAKRRFQEIQWAYETLSCRAT